MDLNLKALGSTLSIGVLFVSGLAFTCIILTGSYWCLKKWKEIREEYSLITPTLTLIVIVLVFSSGMLIGNFSEANSELIDYRRLDRVKKSWPCKGGKGVYKFVLSILDLPFFILEPEEYRRVEALYGSDEFQSNRRINVGSLKAKKGLSFEYNTNRDILGGKSLMQQFLNADKETEQEELLAYKIGTLEIDCEDSFSLDYDTIANISSDAFYGAKNWEYNEPYKEELHSYEVRHKFAMSVGQVMKLLFYITLLIELVRVVGKHFRPFGTLQYQCGEFELVRTYPTLTLAKRPYRDSPKLGRFYAWLLLTVIYYSLAQLAFIGSYLDEIEYNKRVYGYLSSAFDHAEITPLKEALNPAIVLKGKIDLNEPNITKVSNTDWIIPGISGASALDLQKNLFLVIHDWKDNRNGKKPLVPRFGLVADKCRYSVEPVYKALRTDWGEGRSRGSDLEAICQIPGSNGEFLAVESGYFTPESDDPKQKTQKLYGRLFHLTLSEKKGQWHVNLEHSWQIPDDYKDDIEGIACVEIAPEKRIVILAERGSDSEPARFHWGKLEMGSDSFSTDKTKEFEFDEDTWEYLGFSRDCSDMNIDGKGRIWVSGVEDHGDDGPFMSVIAMIGEVKLGDGDLSIELEEPSVVFKEKGIKVEAISKPDPDSPIMYMASDDENRGGQWRAIPVEP